MHKKFKRNNFKDSLTSPLNLVEIRKMIDEVQREVVRLEEENKK